MVDTRVLQTQEWLNATYGGHPGYEMIAENGKTGSQTVHALIRALQIELGISSTSNNFGPETMRRFPNLRKQEEGAGPTNLNYILQGGFWCKGYSPGGFTGNFFEATEKAVKEFQEDVGFVNPNGVVDAKLMKVILNTDGFRLSSTGRPNVREIQKTLNAEYGNYFDYIPTNGHYERKTNQALIYALQHEEGIGSIANGNFGPSTIERCPTLSYDNAPPKFTRILQWALACNSPLYDTNPYDGDFDPQVETAINLFKEFMTLPANGIADMPTIKQLLTSNGYTGRSAIACDASTIIDEDTVRVLKFNGYEIIGRYLTGTVGGTRSKAMTHEELSILTRNGIKVFPIYQDGGWYAEYFKPGQGRKDAVEAMNAAYKLGFPTGTTIYFAVDFDAYDFQVDQLIIPYMAEAREEFDKAKRAGILPEYKLGVYGARNTCIKCMGDSRVRTDHSFVANMSTGFSGNLGYPMPLNWSFGQFFETDIHAVVNNDYLPLRIDKNDYSGRDSGVSELQPPRETTPRYDALFKHWTNIGLEIPILKEMGELFTVEFTFNRNYQVIRTPIFDVDVSTSTTYVDSGEVEGISFTVQGGEVSATLSEMLGAMYGNISSDKLLDIEEAVNNLSFSIGNGFINMSFDISNPEEVSISVTAYKDNIQIEDGDSIQLGITVTYRIKVPPSSPSLERVMVVVALSVAALALLALVTFSSAALGGVATVVSLIALLLTGVEDPQTLI